MALRETKLVSCGESVKVWDLSNFSLLHEFTPPGLSSDFICTTWNKDGNKLVSVPSLSSKLIFSEFQQEKIFNSEVIIGPKISSASYDLGNSRYLVFGTNGGEVLYWDTHHSKIEKTFCSKDSEITSIAFGMINQLAFGTLNGEIYFYNLRNHVATGPMKGDNTEYIRSLDFRKGKLVSASDDGSINLWDANTNKLLQGYENCHQAPAMSVKFLVPNIFTAVSVGLDKKIHFFDFRTKKIVKSFSCDQPLRAVDIISDGISILAGSSKGFINCYTLKSSNVCASFQAHEGPVKYLATNKIVNSSAKSKPLATLNDNKLRSVENHKPKEMGRTIKVISSRKEEISAKLESSSDNYSSSTSSSSYEVPLIIQLKEPASPEQYPVSPDSESLTGSPMGDIPPINEPQKDNPVEDLINYLAANTMIEGQLSERQVANKPVEDKYKSVKETQEVDMGIIIAHVTESIKEAKMEMHMDQMHLFTQMMKQFIDIKEEVRELRERCQANKDTEEELLRLREENRKLKSAY